jgi:hypothetical protein
MATSINSPLNKRLFLFRIISSFVLYFSDYRLIGYLPNIIAYVFGYPFLPLFSAIDTRIPLSFNIVELSTFLFPGDGTPEIPDDERPAQNMRFFLKTLDRCKILSYLFMGIKMNGYTMFAISLLSLLLGLLTSVKAGKDGGE